MRGPWSVLYHALADSFVAGLPEEHVNILLDDAEMLALPAGAWCAHEGEARVVGIIITGTARTFISSADGRQLNVRQLHPGDSFGVTALDGTASLVSVQTQVPSQILQLQQRTVLEMGREHQAVAWAVAQEASRRADDIIGEYRTRAFGSVRQRLARFVLDHATVADDGRLVFRSSRQDMADAIGTTRRVVMRELALLRRVGVIEVEPGRVVVADPAALHAAVRERSRQGRPHVGRLATGR